MDASHLEELAALENHYWWHVAKRQIVVQLLARFSPPPAELIEGGIGAGGNLLICKEMGYRVSGFDLMPEAVLHAQKLGLHEVAVHDIREPWPAQPGAKDIVILLDVLEHVEDPAHVLSHAARVMSQEGVLILTVPAVRFLWGPWDAALGHQRRYSAKLLRTHAKEAGLSVRWMSHWNSFSLPPALVMRSLAKLLGRQSAAKFPRVPSWLNALLRGCACLERHLSRLAPVPLGLSLVGVLTR